MWKNFKQEKPKTKGWYLCTTKVPGKRSSVIKLYWYPHQKKFIDNAIRKVLKNYNVIDKGKKITDLGQDRTDFVVAWMYIPKPYIN